MTHREIINYIEKHYADFGNFDGRTPEEIVHELPDHDPRYETTEGLIDLLNDINYR